MPVDRRLEPLSPHRSRSVRSLSHRSGSAAIIPSPLFYARREAPLRIAAINLLGLSVLGGGVLFAGAVPATADDAPSGVSMFSGGASGSKPMPTVSSRGSEDTDNRSARERVRAISHVRQGGASPLGDGQLGDITSPGPDRVAHEPSPGAIQRSRKLNEEGVELVLQGDQVKGSQKLRSALDADPTNTTALYNLAGVKLSQSHTKEAISLMEQALALSPRDPSYLTRMAECQFSDSNIPQSIYFFERVMAEDERFGDTAFRLGTLYAMVKEWGRAEEMLRKAMDHSPRDVRTLNNLGNVLVVREQFDEAIKVLSMAQKIKASPENSVSLGIAYEAKKDQEKALAQFKEARKLGDTSVDLQKHIGELERELSGGSQSKEAESGGNSESASVPAESSPK